MNEWINIGIEMPPYNEPVLVTDGELYEIRRMKLAKEIRYWDTNGENLNSSATHWMPLPELPETK